MKWLLEHGADFDHPHNKPSLLKMAASPPIIARLKQRQAGGAVTADKTGSPKALEIVWTSTEKELFAGITSRRPEYVREALDKGVDLTALHANYRLPALALTRKLIEEFRDLDLDPGALIDIEQLLVAAGKESSEREAP